MDYKRDPDPGLVKALGLKNIPTSGIAYDLGCGLGRNLSVLAEKYPGKTTGFELNSDFIAETDRRFTELGFSAHIQYADVTKLDFDRDALAVACVGMTIYLPKGMVHELLKKVWAGLKKYGILHVEFATTKDITLSTEFVIYTCVPLPEEGFKNSFYHHCGSYNCQYEHPGVYGASYWKPSEALRAIKKLGKHKLIHYCTREFDQINGYEDGDGNVLESETLFRSFYTVTAQKL